MKTALLWAVCSILLIGTVAECQSVEQLGGWQRRVSTDALTGKTEIEYRFVQKQSDGRTPGIYLVCGGGHRGLLNAAYFTDDALYYDANLGMIDMEYAPTTHLNTFSVLVHYRGADRKIRSAIERAPIADPEWLTLTGAEMKVFGSGGTLVMQYGNSDGNLITDTLQQPGGTPAQSAVMGADCFKEKRKKK